MMHQSPKSAGRDWEMEKAHELPEKRPSRPKFILPLFMLAISCVLLAAIIFISQLTAQAGQQSANRSALAEIHKLGVSETLTLVSLLQGLLAFSATIVLTQALHYLQWGLSLRAAGMPYLDFLALSPMTLDWGSLLLIVSSVSSPSSRMWSIVRLLLFSLVWVSGIILFFRTSLVTEFDTAISYDVTAGVGPFNESYVSSFFEDLNSTAPDYPFSILPYSYYGMVNNLITNSAISTVVDSITCRDEDADCAAYLLSGGVWETAPWMPPGFEDHPIVRIDNVPAVQVDFQGKHGPKDFNTTDCQLLGSDEDMIAAEICVRATKSGAIYAGIFVCTDGIQDGQCATTTPAPNLTSTITFHRRHANLLVSQANYTITSASASGDSDPVAAPVADLAAYKEVLRWLLDYSAANIPAPSSIVENFWTASAQLQNPTTDAFFLQNFRSILAFPVWLFNANNYGNDALTEKAMASDLPPEFYMQASLVRPFLMLRFDPAILAAFVACQGVVILFSAGVLIWAMCHAKTLPIVSSFPVFDSYFKPEVRVKEPMDNLDLWRAGDSEILQLMRGATVARKPSGWPLRGWI